MMNQSSWIQPIATATTSSSSSSDHNDKDNDRQTTTRTPTKVATGHYFHYAPPPPPPPPHPSVDDDDDANDMLTSSNTGRNVPATTKTATATDITRTMSLPPPFAPFAPPLSSSLSSSSSSSSAPLYNNHQYQYSHHHHHHHPNPSSSSPMVTPPTHQQKQQRGKYGGDTDTDTDTAAAAAAAAVVVVSQQLLTAVDDDDDTTTTTTTIHLDAAINNNNSCHPSFSMDGDNDDVNDVAMPTSVWNNPTTTTTTATATIGNTPQQHLPQRAEDTTEQKTTWCIRPIGTTRRSSSSTVTTVTTAVPHVYHDYSQLWLPGGTTPGDGENHYPTIAGTTPTTTLPTIPFIRKKTGGVSQPFPEKLHEMLTTIDRNATTITTDNHNGCSSSSGGSGSGSGSTSSIDEQSIVSWLPHGRAFIVRKPKEFTQFIMPKYFKQTKLTSFQRQLNLYGFRRLTQGVDAGAYYHELFLRVCPTLCHRMVRQKVKGTGHKQPADVKTEPNFYEMASLQLPPPAPPITASSTSASSSQMIHLPVGPTDALSPPSLSTDNPPLHDSELESHNPAMQERYDYSYQELAQTRPQMQETSPDERDNSNNDILSHPTSSSYMNSNILPSETFSDYQQQGYNHSFTSGSTHRKNNNHIAAVDSILDSPGLQCAAHLLQGIASGFSRNKNLHIPEGADLPSAANISDTRGNGLVPRRKSRPLTENVVSFDQLTTDDTDRHAGATSYLQPRLSNEFRYNTRK